MVDAVAVAARRNGVQILEQGGFRPFVVVVSIHIVKVCRIMALSVFLFATLSTLELECLLVCHGRWERLRFVDDANQTKSSIVSTERRS